MKGHNIRVAATLCVLWVGGAGAAGDEAAAARPDPWALVPWLLDALPVAVLAVLVFRCRKGLVAAPIQWRHRLLLALAAGWLSAVIYRLTGDWLFGLPGVAGVLAIGALFGLFVLAPLLPRVAGHPLRVAVLVSTAALAHYMAWLVAASLFDLIHESFDDRGEAVIMSGGLGGPALVVFALVTTIAAWRTAALRLTGRFWLALFAGSWVSGWLYQSAALDTWGASLITTGRVSEYDIYPVLMFWFAVSSLVFSLAPWQAPRTPRGPDFALLAGLLLGSAWVVWSILAGGL